MQATNLIKFPKETNFFFDTKRTLGLGTNLGARVAQWWEYSPSTNTSILLALCYRYKTGTPSESVSSLVLIWRRSTCDIAAGTTWDTVAIWEQKWPATLVIPVFIAGMPAKLTRVQVRRHAHVLIRPGSSPDGTGGIWEPGFSLQNTFPWGASCSLRTLVFYFPNGVCSEPEAVKWEFKFWMCRHSP